MQQEKEGTFSMKTMDLDPRVLYVKRVQEVVRVMPMPGVYFESNCFGTIIFLQHLSFCSGRCCRNCQEKCLFFSELLELKTFYAEDIGDRTCCQPPCTEGGNGQAQT